MQRGIVIEAGKKWSVVLTPDGQFCKVPTQPNFVEGVEISFSIPVPLSTFQAKGIMSRRWVKSVSALAACLLLIVLIFPFFSGNQAYAAVTIDINPSVELDVDRNANVLGVHPLNDDAKKILEHIQWKNQAVTTVAVDIIQAAKTEGLMNQENQVIIATAPYTNGSLDKEQQLDHQLEEVSSKVDQDITIILVNGNKQWFDEAKKQDVPPGYYMVAKQAEEQGLNIQPADIQKGQYAELPEVKGVKVIHPRKPPSPKETNAEPLGQPNKEIQPVNGNVEDNSNTPSISEQNSYIEKEKDKENHEQKNENHQEENQKKKVEKSEESNDSVSNHGQGKNFEQRFEQSDKKKDKEHKGEKNKKDD